MSTVIRLAAQRLGSPEAVREFLNTQNERLNGSRPLELASRSPAGMHSVVALLTASGGAEPALPDA